MHVWKFLNFFKRATLNQLLKDFFATSAIDAIDGKGDCPVLPESLIETLFNDYFKPALKETCAPISKDLDKRQKQLNRLLSDPDTTMIIERGPPGAGKVYNVRHSGKKYFADINQWLEAKPDANDKEPIVLLIRGANTFLPRTFDFLKGILRKDKKITYQGKDYALTPQHKFVATMSSDRDIGCFSHTLFQQGEEIYYSPPTPDLLEKNILETLLPLNLNKKPYKEILLYAALEMEKYYPDKKLSYCDMASLTTRFVMCAKKQGEGKQALYSACSVEFAGSIVDTAQRKKFLENLQTKIFGQVLKTPSQEGLITLTPEFKLPTEKQYLQDALIQFIEHDQYFSAHPDTQLMQKKLLLIQGEPGVGKSKHR